MSLNNKNNSNNNSKQITLYSKYNDLSKIYDINTNKLVEIIPSPNHYYDSEEGKIKKVIDKNNTGPILLKKYSILGINSNNNNDHKATLIKLKSGSIALKIPYVKLIIFYREND